MNAVIQTWIDGPYIFIVQIGISTLKEASINIKGREIMAPSSDPKERLFTSKLCVAIFHYCIYFWCIECSYQKFFRCFYVIYAVQHSVSLKTSIFSLSQNYIPRYSSSQPKAIDELCIESGQNSLGFVKLMVETIESSVIQFWGLPLHAGKFLKHPSQCNGL